jgi:flagellar hook protein FlgE
MMRSMFAGVSGTRAHQVRMDVIGNNIANVNTVGYKYGRATFQDMLSQTMRGSMAPTGNRGGVDPMQVGMGVSTRSIDIVFTPGNLEYTGRLTDMAIQGSGLFVVRDSSGGLMFTRDGAFKIDAEGNLTHPSTGFMVQGWMADAKGTIDRSGEIQGLRIPLGTSMSAKATDRITFVGNLNAEGDVGTLHSTSVPIYDSLGIQHTLILEFEKTGDKAWTWTARYGELDSDTGEIPSVGTGVVTFDENGAVVRGQDPSQDPAAPTITFTPAGGAADLKVNLDFTALSQFGEACSVNWSTQDGYAAGTMETFNIDDRGIITGVYSNSRIYWTTNSLKNTLFTSAFAIRRATASTNSALNASLGSPGSSSSKVLDESTSMIASRSSGTFPAASVTPALSSNSTVSVHFRKRWPLVSAMFTINVSKVYSGPISSRSAFVCSVCAISDAPLSVPGARRATRQYPRIAPTSSAATANVVFRLLLNFLLLPFSAFFIPSHPRNISHI